VFLCYISALNATLPKTLLVPLSAMIFATVKIEGAPVVFWGSEPVQPGDVVMVYGGNLSSVVEVRVTRIPDCPCRNAFSFLIICSTKGRNDSQSAYSTSG